MSLGGSTPSPSAFPCVPLAKRQGRQPSKLASWVQLPEGTSSVMMIGDRLVVGFLALNQATEVPTLLPELPVLLRGRLTVGRDVLNVFMLVRFQPPQPRKGEG